MITWSFWLMLAVAVVDWVAAWRGWRSVRWVTKPGTLILLIGWYTQVGGWRGPLIWFGLGLVFSLLGDILLNFPSARFFMPGVGAFFLAHLSYITGFVQQPLFPRWTAFFPLLLVGIVFWLLIQRLRSGLHAHSEMDMSLPVMVYAGALSLMWLSAMSTLFRAGWAVPPAPIVSLGAGLFFLSDAILAYNRFVRPVRSSDLLVMVTYHLGQILIALGVLIQFA